MAWNVVCHSCRICYLFLKHYLCQTVCVLCRFLQLLFKTYFTAYETLSDENKRREYDQFGHAEGRRSNGNAFNFNFDDLFKDFDFFGQTHNTQSKKHFDNHFRNHQNVHSRQRRSFPEFSFGGGLFDDMFEDMEKMFSFNDFDNTHQQRMRTGGKFHGSSKHCRTVTQRRGNMVTTFTDCSGQ